MNKLEQEAIDNSETMARNVLTILGHAFATVRGAFTQEIPKLEGDAEAVASDLLETLVPNAEAQAYLKGVLGSVEEKTPFSDLSAPAQASVHIAAARVASMKV